MPSKYNKLQDKHVLIIGGSSGIGLGVAEGALSSGAKVTIASSSEAKIDQALVELRGNVSGARVMGFTADLSAEDLENTLTGLLDKAARANGRVNHIVYTAADAIPSASISTFTAETFRKATYVRSVVPMTLAKLVATGDYLDKDRGSSVTITGGNVAVHPIPDWALVNFIASGLEGATRGLALDLAPIRVNLVAPGAVDTGIWGDARGDMVERMDKAMPTRKIGQVKDVVEAYLWLLKDGNATGTIARTESGHNLL